MEMASSLLALGVLVGMNERGRLNNIESLGADDVFDDSDPGEEDNDDDDDDEGDDVAEEGVDEYDDDADDADDVLEKKIGGGGQGGNSVGSVERTSGSMCEDLRSLR